MPRNDALSDDDRDLLDRIEVKVGELEALVNEVIPGRHRSLALTALETVVMWVEKQMKD